MREVLVGLAIAAVLVVGIALIYGGTGSKLSARDQVLANEFSQLRAFFRDRATEPSLPDHLYKMLSDGTGLFLHFDKPVGQDSKVLWIGTIVPGRFCKADEERVRQTYGPGFVHFHQKFIPGNDPNAGHGGKGGEDGFWFRHIAVTEIPFGDMMAGTGVPWGPVSPGIDMSFMPTPAPECP
jgi:hypothetical protein